MTTRIPLLLVVGPTAAGKTVLALQLARERGGEIISVDSRQVYQRLTIGTAKPKGEWKDDFFLVQDVAYHLVDFLKPSEPFSAAAFARMAKTKIEEIRVRGRLPILAGGTGFYFRALLEGLAPMPTADDALRQELRRVAERQGRRALHAELERVDPKAAAVIPPNNIQRLIRALEVFRLTGRPISSWHDAHQSADRASPYDVEVIGVDPGREELEQRIRERTERMLRDGMIEETKAALAEGCAPGCPGLSGLGYPRVVQFLGGQLSKTELADLIVRDTRQYAKRQRTWFRHQMKVQWKKS